MRHDSQMKHDVHTGSMSGTPQNNAPNQGNQNAGGNVAASGAPDSVAKMTQTSNGPGGSTSHLGR